MSKIFGLINLKNIRNNTMRYKAQQEIRLISNNLHLKLQKHKHECK